MTAAPPRPRLSRLATMVRATRLMAVAVCLLAAGGCGDGDGEGTKREFISVGTAPIGGVFYTVGSAVCDVINEAQGDLGWRVSAESTGGSM